MIKIVFVLVFLVGLIPPSPPEINDIELFILSKLIAYLLGIATGAILLVLLVRSNK